MGSYPPEAGASNIEPDFLRTPTAPPGPAVAMFRLRSSAAGAKMGRPGL